MDCSQFRKYLDNYENLDDLQLKALFDHADVCEECRCELDFFNSVISTAASIPVPEMPVDFIEQVNKRIDAEPVKTGFIYKLNIVSKRYAAVAACIAIGLVVGLNRTNIEDKLTGKDHDDVIQSTVVTSMSTAIPVADTVIETEIPVEQETAKPITTIAPKTFYESTINPTVQPTVKPIEKATVKPTTKPTVRSTEKAVVKATVKPTVKPTEKPTESVARAIITPKATQTPLVTPSVTEETAVISETIEPETKNNIERNYTLERAEYYVPETETVTEEVTDKPDMENYSLATTAPETKYSYREQATATPSVSNVIADYLLVSSEDIDVVASVLNELGIARAQGLYMTQTSTFYELLDRLNDRNIQYDCSIKYTTGDKISFKVLLK